MWNYLDSQTALLARELGAVPKFPPELPRRKMLPVPKKLAFASSDVAADAAASALGAIPKYAPPVPKKFAAMDAVEIRGNKRKSDSDHCMACTCRRKRWSDQLTDLDKVLLGIEM